MPAWLRRVLWSILAVSTAFNAVYLSAAFVSRHEPAAALESGLFSEPDPDGPRIAWEESVYDFGLLGQRQKVRHVFRFRNVGRKELRITGLRTSCGCTASVVSEETLPPGGSGELLVEFDPGQRSGPFENTVEVASNDPFTLNIVRITGRVQPFYWCVPEVVDFGLVPPGKMARREVLVCRLRPDLPLSIGKVVSTNPAVSLENLSRTADGYRFEAVARPGKEDTVQGALQIGTGDPRVPEIWVRTTGLVDPPPGQSP